MQPRAQLLLPQGFAQPKQLLKDADGLVLIILPIDDEFFELFYVPLDVIARDLKCITYYQLWPKPNTAVLDQSIFGFLAGTKFVGAAHHPKALYPIAGVRMPSISASDLLATALRSWRSDTHVRFMIDKRISVWNPVGVIHLRYKDSILKADMKSGFTVADDDATDVDSVMSD